LKRRGPARKGAVDEKARPAAGVYRKIVVATDGSQGSARAVETAVELAKNSAAKLLAVCLARVNEYALLESEGVDPQAEERCEVALSAATRIAQAAGVEIHIERVRGHPVDRILAIVEREQPDLLVVGTRGLSRSKRILMGSVSDAVSKHAPCAVLVVR